MNQDVNPKKKTQYLTVDQIAIETNVPKDLCREVARLTVGPFRGTTRKRVCPLEEFDRFMRKHGAVFSELLESRDRPSVMSQQEGADS